MNYGHHNPTHEPANGYLYGAALVTCLTGITAIASAVESSAFCLFACALAVVGYLMSMRLRRQGRNLRIVETIVIGICLATYARLFATGEINPIFNPGISLYHKELSLAVMLVWAEVVRSFSLVSDESLLFVAVPSLALIGVVATTSPGPDVLAYFSVWLCSSLVMFIESSKAADRRAGLRTGTHVVSLAVGLGIVSVLTGLLTGPLIHKTATWGFLQIAPDLYTSRRGGEATSGDSGTNELEISKGPVILTSTIEMRVATSMPTYWRARIWDEYSGRGWKSPSRSESRMPLRYGEINTFTSDRPTEGRAITKVTQAFEVLSNNYALRDTRTFLHAAAEVRSIHIGTNSLQSDQFNCWKLESPPVLDRFTYVVESEVPTPTPSQLRKASEKYPAWMTRYTLTPMDTRPVRELAIRITKNIPTQYEKVLALQRFLWENCTYDLQTPPLPVQEQDAVSYFLFKSQRGYCDVFASALAIMSRCVGIPARIATGFLPGEYDSATSTYVVRDRDRHSWTEIYFPGYGWIPMEATPSDNSPHPNYWESLRTELRQVFSGPNTSLLILLGILTLGVVGLRMLHPEEQKKEKASLGSPITPEIRRARKIWRQFAKLLSGYGVQAGRSTTPMELYYDARESLGDGCDAAVDAIRRTAEILSEILYAGLPDAGLLISDLEAAFKQSRLELTALVKEWTQDSTASNA